MCLQGTLKHRCSSVFTERQPRDKSANDGRALTVPTNHPTRCVAAAGEQHGPRLREGVGPRIAQVDDQVNAAGRPRRGRRQVSIHPAAQVPAAAAHALEQAHRVPISAETHMQHVHVAGGTGLRATAHCMDRLKRYDLGQGDRQRQVGQACICCFQVRLHQLVALGQPVNAGHKLLQCGKRCLRALVTLHLAETVPYLTQ